MVPPIPTLTESPEELKESPMVAPPKVERESEPTKELSAAAVKEPEPPERVAQIAPREPSGAVIAEEPKESPIASPLEIEKKSEPIREASVAVVQEPKPPGQVAQVAPRKPSGAVIPERPKGSPIASPIEVERKSEPIREAFVTAVKKPEEPVGPAKDALLEPSRKGTPKEPKESPAASPLTVNRESEPIKEVPNPGLKVPGLSAREAKVMPSQPNRTVIPEVAKTPTSSLVLPSISGESEVRQFLARYTERYNQKDIDGFISFFSAKAVQNQKDDIEKIRKVYANFFQHNEELRYKVRDVKIEPHKDGLQVMADYELEGVLKKGKERKVWRGQVRWVLIKEEGKLKVLSLDYQPQKYRD
jgi:ketosteroid isomerase-like protein